MLKLLMFGAGNIGRSFIAQLFSRSGYQVCFVDKNEEVVDNINRFGSYRLIIRHIENSEITISGISAIHTSDINTIENEIFNSDSIAVSVGNAGFIPVISLIGNSLVRIREKHPAFKSDIIIAENTREASLIAKNTLVSCGLPPEYINDCIGLVETSIGKMVPLASVENKFINPLDVVAEPYNNLIVDKLAFKKPIPQIIGLLPKENMKAWVDRKLFIHNLGHACLAYFSFLYEPSIVYTWESLEKPGIRKKVQEAMKESASILERMHPGVFSTTQLEEHINDLLNRFANKALGDTVFRVGKDLERKLGPDDRLVPVIRFGIENKLECSTIIEALFAALHFRCKDQYGNFHEPDISFLHKFNLNIPDILHNHCKFDPARHKQVFQYARNQNPDL